MYVPGFVVGDKRYIDKRVVFFLPKKPYNKLFAILSYY